MSTPPQQGLKTSSCVVICGILSVLGLGLFGFSSPAYAEVTTLTVSNSGETISFDKIKPSGSGTVTKATDSLSVNTNCTEGIDLYMSAQNGSSHGTSLVNNTANSNNEITTLSGTTIGDSSTAKALSSNTWGFNTVDNNTYYGLPTYASALSHAVYSGTDSSIPIYYGAKVTSSMATGKYSGSVLYTVLVNMNCNNYTVEYDINTPEGAEGSIVSSTPPDDTILTYAKKSKLAENTFEITGYNFLGWSLSPTATTPEYDANTTEYYGSDIALAASADPGSTITMYAVWEEQTIYMQEWLGCYTISIGESATLTDSRDNKKYTVKKLPDGKCWMMQNLTINGVELTPDDTNITDGNTYYLPKDGGAGSITSSSTKNATTGYNFSGSDNQAMFKFRSKNTAITNDSDTGYYNFYTATLGYSYYNDGKAVGTSPQDICPKGWRMPRTTDSGSVSAINSTNDFTYLARTYSTSDWNGSSVGLGGYGYYSNNSTVMDSMYRSAASPLATPTTNNYAGFSYAGYWVGTISSAYNVGSRGYYWSASVYSTNDSYRLYFDSSLVYPQNGNNDSKNNGYAVRCVDQNSDVAGYMQDFETGTELLNTNESVKLLDKRDGKIYTVKRLPDGKVWMMQNLTIGSTITSNDGMALTSQDTNIDDDTVYYLPPAGKQGTGTITQKPNVNGTPNSRANFSSSEDTHAKTGFRKSSSYNGGTNDSDTGYYNFYTATLGYSYYNDNSRTSGTSPRDICPKGWRMPKTTNAGTTVSTTDINNDFAYLISKYGPLSGEAASTDYYSNNTTVKNSMYLSAASPLATATTNNYAGFSYSGIWDAEDGSANSVSEHGFYLSASIYDSSSSYYLNFLSTFIYPQSSNGKYRGFAVRCIAKDTRTLSDLTYMQDINNDIVANTPINTITTLIDKRDNHEYKVKKLPDGKIWMVQNLTLTATDLVTENKALTKADTNINDDSSYYIPPKNARYTSSYNLNTQAVASSSTPVSFEYSLSNYLQVGYRNKDDTNNSTSTTQPEDTAYYNFYTATLGFSHYQGGASSGSSPRDICPKGWRLPWTSSSGATKQGSAEFYRLALVYNNDPSVWSNYIAPTNTSTSAAVPSTSDATVRNNMIYGDANSLNPTLGTNSAVGFTYTGYYDSAMLYNVGTEGSYWSSSVYGDIHSYRLLVNTSVVSPQVIHSKYYGFAIRCVTGSR